MREHDEDRSGIWRRPVEHHTVAHDVDGQAALRAVAAGHVQTVGHGAVLRLQRLAGNAGVGQLVEDDEERRSPVLDVVGKGAGTPLSTAVRGQMEAGLGADFGDVRVHDDDAAAASAQAVNAKAYTVGNDVVFNKGAYQPHTDEGRHTLAHELTHVVQQRSGPVEGTATGDGVALSDPGDRFEREAEVVATSLGHASPTETPGPSAGAVQRTGADGTESQIQAMTLQREEVADEEPDEDVAAQAVALQREDSEDEDTMV